MERMRLPSIRIVPKGGFYDFHAKYVAEDTQYLCPGMQDEAEMQLRALALLALMVPGWFKRTMGAPCTTEMPMPRVMLGMKMPRLCRKPIPSESTTADPNTTATTLRGIFMCWSLRCGVWLWDPMQPRSQRACAIPATP